MEIRDDGLLIRPLSEHRSGWDDAFRRMRKHGDDTLVDERSSATTQWDITEWEW